MELGHIITFNITLLLAMLGPGPSLLFLIRATLANGRRTGIMTGLGLAVMAALWTLAALLGLNGLFTVFPWAYGVLKISGACYLIYLAYSTWRHARDPVAESDRPTGGRAFLSGILLNLSNPKSVIFAAAVLLVIFPDDLTAGEKTFIFLNHLTVELIVQPLLAILLSSPLVRRRYLAAKPALDRAAAAIMGALGLRLLFDNR